MDEITVAAVEQYMLSLLPERDAVLREMEAQAAKRNIPIVGPAVGRLLYQLAQMIHARTVFEMGSAIGYSTLWLARAVGPAGRVIYTDGNRANAEEARGYFERAGVTDRIEIRVGEALEILSEQKTQFDLIFNDIDKEDYPRAYRLAVPLIRKGGLFVSDNVLWHGRVGKELKPDDLDTNGILEFNTLLYQSKDLFTTILPLRDGVAVAMRV